MMTPRGQGRGHGVDRKPGAGAAGASFSQALGLGLEVAAWWLGCVLINYAMRDAMRCVRSAARLPCFMCSPGNRPT